MQHSLQYVDRNVGPADYSHLASDELLVTSIFLTLQGEGPLAGKVSVFIRLSGCDKGDKVSCPWCDTNFIYSKGTTYSISELKNAVERQYEASSAPGRLIILTGGEPMLQSNIVHLIESMPDYKFQIESNGDRLAVGFAESAACKKAMLVVSPKVNPKSQAYQNLPRTVFQRADVLKFVVEADVSSPYNDIPHYASEWGRFGKNTVGSVYISPITVYKRAVKEGERANIWDDTLIDREATRRNYEYAASLCIRSGYTFSCQQHLFNAVE